jgi:hypothetical protein
MSDGSILSDRSILMDRQFSNATSSLASAALKLCTELAKYWWTVLADQGSSYRPELHYMRGRGPKWREAQVRLRNTR